MRISDWSSDVCSSDLDVITARNAIEESIAGLTLATALQRTAEAFGDQPAYSDKVGITSEDGSGWRTITWREVREASLDLAAGLAELGVEPGDTVALMASSRTEHVLADLAAVHAARHRCRSMRPSPPPRSSTSWATPTRPWWCSRAPTI